MTRARLLYPSSNSRKMSDRLHEELKQPISHRARTIFLRKTSEMHFLYYTFQYQSSVTMKNQKRLFYEAVSSIIETFPEKKIISIARNLIHIGKTVATDNISRRNFVVPASPHGITELCASHAGLMLDHVTVSVDVGSPLDTSHGRHLRRDHAGSPR